MKFFKSMVHKYKKLSVVAKASLWFVICGFLQRGISIITTPIFTRLFETTEYGTYTVFNSWLEIFTILCTLKLGQGVCIQGLVKYGDDQDKMSSSLLGLATTWWACSFVIYFVFRSFWNELLGLSTYMMVCMFLMMISTVGFNFWAARQRNEFKYIKLVKLTIAISVLKPVTGIVAVFLTDTFKVEARIGALTLVELLAYSLLYLGIMRRGKVFYDKKYWKYALSFNLPLVPHFFSQVILNHSDRIVIQRLIGYSEAGIYSLAYSLAMILSMFNTSIQNAFRPWMFQKIKAKEYNEIKSIGTGSLVVVGICNLALIAFAPELVAIFAPESYQGAVELIAPITMGVYFAFMYNLFVNVQMYYEKTKSIMVVAIICALINIVSNYYFIGIFGYIAAAYTTLVSYILMAFMHFYAMRRVQRRYQDTVSVYDIKSFVFVTIVFVAIGSILGLLAEYIIVRAGFIAVTCVVIYMNKKRIINAWHMLKSSRM